jgi:3-deoxy-manno-octulosonate cytidylyltransferase (CMP-KDO synthetase)
MRIVGVVPARFASTRLEGKPLREIHGKPMIQHVYERARRAKCLAEVIVATDDVRIRKAVEGFGGRVAMTSSQHATGTDRVAEVAASLDADVVVNIQGDEPLLDPILIDECVLPFSWNPPAEIATVMKRVPEESAYSDPAVVKVVRDLSGRALYFSRSLLPFPRNKTADFKVYEHIGIYAYTKDALVKFSRLEPTPLELIEGLEQLRALEHGMAIHLVETRCQCELVSVDTPADLERVRQIMAASAEKRDTE